jgi:hypothetical protein
VDYVRYGLLLQPPALLRAPTEWLTIVVQSLHLIQVPTYDFLQSHPTAGQQSSPPAAHYAAATMAQTLLTLHVRRLLIGLCSYQGGVFWTVADKRLWAQCIMVPKQALQDQNISRRLPCFL